MKKGGKGVFKFLIRFILIVVVLGGIAVLIMSCNGTIHFKFKVESAGSAVRFSKELMNSYKIKELDINIDGTSFYSEDYFYSETLGTEYSIRTPKLGIPVGKVYLASKKDLYNPEKYVFNVEDYRGQVLTIGKDMNYVTIQQSTYETIPVVIKIEKRTLPLDLTLSNVNIISIDGVPTIISESLQDINLIVKGNNEVYCSKQPYTLVEFVRAKSQNTSFFIDLYSDSCKALQGTIDAAIKGTIDTTVDALNGSLTSKQVFNTITDIGTNFLDSEVRLMETLWSAAGTVFVGKTGDAGKDGSPAILHFGNISIYTVEGGKLNVTGGDGGDGGNASNSIFGTANGGNGGKGGEGIICGIYFEYLPDDTFVNGKLTVVLSGGAGGHGGEPSKALGGLWGSSGSRGNTGSKGQGISAYQQIRIWPE